MEDELPFTVGASYFDPEKKYYYGDIVIYDGCTYFANEDVIEEYPDISSSWTKCTISRWMGNNSVGFFPGFDQIYANNYGIAQDQNFLYTTSSNTGYSNQESRQIELLQAEINRLKIEIAEIKKELRLVKTQEETEHRKLSI